MIGYTLRRLLFVFPVLLGITVLVFGLLAMLPGDPALAILGPYATPERIAELEASLGLGEPLPVQFLHWLENLLRGDFGRSYVLERPVSDILAERLGPTLLLAIAALTIATVFGLLLGTLAAITRGSWLDRALTAIAVTGFSTPAFWLAMMLVLVFAVQLGWFPVSGMRSLHGDGGVTDMLHHLALPALSLGVIAAGVIARMMRAAMIETLATDYVLLARSRGLPESRVRYRLAFRAALARIVPVIGLQAGFVLGGAVYIETVFQWPGIGRTLVDAIAMRDLLLVQGGVIVVATIYVLVNLLTDIVQRLLDPRADV
jgi:peptide/nickel transport system permease protein